MSDEVETLAELLWAKAVSGYTWNVSETWDAVHYAAKNVWRQRAADIYEFERSAPRCEGSP